jgi:flavodoxin
MKILVAFYSWKGHTETVARALALKLEAPVVRIEPRTEPGTGMGGKAMKAVFGLRGSIKPTQTDLKEIDHLVIATPVWAHKIPPYIRQYLSELTNCSGKKFSVLTEMGGSGAESAIAIVRKILEAKGMTFVASATTIEKDVEAKKFDETLDQFTQKIQVG